MFRIYRNVVNTFSHRFLTAITAFSSNVVNAFRLYFATTFNCTYFGHVKNLSCQYLIVYLVKICLMFVCYLLQSSYFKHIFTNGLFRYRAVIVVNIFKKFFVTMLLLKYLTHMSEILNRELLKYIYWFFKDFCSQSQ